MRKNNYAADPLLRSFGVSISNQFAKVEGRVLPVPKVSTSHIFHVIYIFHNDQYLKSLLLEYCED